MPQVLKQSLFENPVFLREIKNPFFIANNCFLGAYGLGIDIGVLMPDEKGINHSS